MVATEQGGVVARWQLAALGAGRGEVRWRLDHGRLSRLHRGVYAVGHQALGHRGRAFAALLAAGPGALLSHRSAAAVWGLLPHLLDGFELTVVGRRARSRPGIAIHHAAALPPDELMRRDGLPVSAPLRTLLDLATTAPAADLQRALAEAQVLRLVSEADVLETPRRPGAARLKAALGSAAAAPTRSRLERAFLRLVKAAVLSRPQVNARVAGAERDFVWPEQRVVVEVDGWHAHGHRAAFERDRARDALLQSLGYAVLRFTWRQVNEEPLLVAARLAQVLSSRPRSRFRDVTSRRDRI